VEITRYVNIQIELEESGAAQNIISIGVQNSHELLTGVGHHSIVIPNPKPSYSANTFTKKQLTGTPVAENLIFKTTYMEKHHFGRPTLLLL
jgi:hypothetical protein